MINPTVFVVDDDRQARQSVTALVRSMGLCAEPFSSAEEFLDAYTPGHPGCLVTDLRMYGMSGLELLEKLVSEDIFLPVIVITAYAKTALTGECMQKGALTLLDKPYDDDDLWRAIRKALEMDASARHEYEYRREIHRRITNLNVKEQDVLDRIVAGKANKVIAKELHVSIRTVENRRREVFAKMQADSVAELVHMVLRAQGCK